MTDRKLTNLPASVRQRLLNIARDTGRPFQELLQYYAMERFLYRLSRSSYADRFVLKGALMLPIWSAPVSRPTRDIDLLGHLDHHLEYLIDVIRQICRQDVEPDGIVFDCDQVEGEEIREAATYGGVRIRFPGSLGTARVRIQIDIGFGDVIIPSAADILYPTVLDFPAPALSGYTRESMIAEKLETMVTLDAANTRMKDFFDIWLLSHQFEFDGTSLAAAIHETFSNRKTEMPARSFALSRDFSDMPAKIQQWQGFLRNMRIETVPGEFGEIIDDIGRFLLPIVEALSSNRSFRGTWRATGPWSHGSTETGHV